MSVITVKSTHLKIRQTTASLIIIGCFRQQNSCPILSHIDIQKNRNCNTFFPRRCRKLKKRIVVISKRPELGTRHSERQVNKPFDIRSYQRIGNQYIFCPYRRCHLCLGNGGAHKMCKSHLHLHLNQFSGFMCFYMIPEPVCSPRQFNGSLCILHNRISIINQRRAYNLFFTLYMIIFQFHIHHSCSERLLF